MKNNQSGFTLVEIAIVLVIIGLLLGGVLKGQELINSAKVKNLANDFRNIPTMVFAAIRTSSGRFPGMIVLLRLTSPVCPLRQMVTAMAELMVPGMLNRRLLCDRVMQFLAACSSRQPCFWGNRSWKLQTIFPRNC